LIASYCGSFQLFLHFYAWHVLTSHSRGLIFSKKFFWFGSEPVEQKYLSNYLRGEKPEHGNSTVAWASHTGKGLLFFTKKEAEKATPASIINLVRAA
jgi:hypothetical protein